MTIRDLDFADSFQSSASPTAGVISVNQMKSFANDAAFVADKGSAASVGDIYFNTTTGFFRLHNGTVFVELVDNTAAQTVSGDKTFDGTTLFVNTTNLEVVDKNINLNNTGNDASSEGAGINIERTGVDGSLVYQDALISKWKAGALGSEVELANISGVQTLTNKTIDAALNTLTNLPAADPVAPGFINFGIAAATTITANDSIKITSSDGTAFSGGNPGTVLIPGASAGQIDSFTVSADIIIDLTGAHWGLGTNGDFTDYMLSVYAINDGGTLRWGVASIPNHHKILTADTNITATNINLVDEVLVNTAVLADAQSQELGWFKANFDDTGGAAEDLWSVQTAIGDINLGARPSLWQVWVPTGTWTTNTTYTGFKKRIGEDEYCKITVSLSGVPTATGLSIDMPTGEVIDTIKITSPIASEDILGETRIVDAGVSFKRRGTMAFSNTTRLVAFGPTPASSENESGISSTVPITFVSGDKVYINFKVPIVGWD